MEPLRLFRYSEDFSEAAWYPFANRAAEAGVILYVIRGLFFYLLGYLAALLFFSQPALLVLLIAVSSPFVYHLFKLGRRYDAIRESR